MCPIYTLDGASAKFTTNSNGTDYSDILRYWALPDSDSYFHRWLTDKARAVRKLVARLSNGVFAVLYAEWWWIWIYISILDLDPNHHSAKRARSRSELLSEFKFELVADGSGGYTGHIKCAEAFFQLGLKRWCWSLEKSVFQMFVRISTNSSVST